MISQWIKPQANTLQSNLFSHEVCYRSNPKEQDETLKEAIFQARNYKNWRDFANCGYKVSQEPSQADKRVKRYLMIGQAIDAFEDVPKEPKGGRFMHGDWF